MQWSQYSYRYINVVSIGGNYICTACKNCMRYKVRYKMLLFSPVIESRFDLILIIQ